MTSAISLDFIREAAEKKYAAREVDLGDGKTVALRNPLRLSGDERKALTELELGNFDDPIDYFEAAFAIASSEKDAKELRKVLGDDTALYATLFEVYVKDVELGEASPSQD